MTDRPLKILYHHRTQGRGAEGVHIASIVRELEKAGHQVKVLSPAGVDPLSKAGAAPVDKANVKTQGVGSLWKFISKKLPNFLFEIAEIFYNIVAARALERELAREKYDLIYERYAFYLIAGAIKANKYKIPLILEANEVSGIKERARKQSFKWLCDRFEGFLFKRCFHVHTVSSYLKSMICARGVPDDRVLVTPNAIDPEKFSGKHNNDQLRQSLGLKDRQVIGFAGWFDHWDRLDLLLDVFNKLHKKHDNLSLLLIGDGAVLGPLRNSIKQMQLEDRVVLTGAVPRTEIQNYLSLLDIAVFTHSNEFGSPVVMFEFMGLKIPVIAPKLMPITDVLQHEQSALLFDVLNMQQLESLLDRAPREKSLRHQLAEHAYTLLMSNYTWQHNANKIVEAVR